MRRLLPTHRASFTGEAGGFQAFSRLHPALIETQVSWHHQKNLGHPPHDPKSAHLLTALMQGPYTVLLGVQISLAGDMATWLVKHSQLHPAFRDLPVVYGMNMGGGIDPTTQGSTRRFEGLILQLQKAAYEQAKHLVRQQRTAIEKLAAELTGNSQETLQGPRIVEVLETTAVAQPELQPSNGVWSEHLQPTQQVSDHQLHHGCRLHFRSMPACLSGHPPMSASAGAGSLSQHGDVALNSPVSTGWIMYLSMSV